MGGRFRREEHLKGRKEIREVFDKGKRYYYQGAKLFVLKNGLPYNRICFTLSRTGSGASNGSVAPKGSTALKGKSFRSAVVRNRAKRLGREAFRLMKPRLLGGYDLVLLVSYEAKMALSLRVSQLEFLFTKAGLFFPDNKGKTRLKKSMVCK